jgi:hypothetical protein
MLVRRRLRLGARPLRRSPQMRDAAEPGDYDPPGPGQLLDQPMRAELGIVGVIEDEIAPRDEVRCPGIEVSPNTSIRVVAVEPEERHRLRPPCGDYLAARVQEAHRPIRACANHVAEERRAILGAEPPAARTDERLVWLDGVDADAVTVLSTAGQDNGGAPAEAPDLDDAPLPDSLCKIVEKNGCVAGQPPPDRGDLAQLLRPIVSWRQACESIAAMPQQTILRLVPLIWMQCR